MIFLNSASSAAALVFYLPGVCTHTDTEGKQSPEYFNILRKNTIFNEHPVPGNAGVDELWDLVSRQPHVDLEQVLHIIYDNMLNE